MGRFIFSQFLIKVYDIKYYFFFFVQGRKIILECVELVNIIIVEEEFCVNFIIISIFYINFIVCIEKVIEMKVSKLFKGESGVKLFDVKDLFLFDFLDENIVVDVKVRDKYSLNQLWSVLINLVLRLERMKKM